MEGANLKGIDLRGAELKGGNFKDANFRYTDLREANLEGADLRGAKLRHVVLIGSNLSNADLREADLTHADLRGANLAEAKLEHAMVKGAKGISSKVFFTQKTLDSLNEKNKISLDGDTLTIMTEEQPTFNIVPAYRFLRVEEGQDDSLKILGKVKTEDEAKELSIDIYRDSAIYKETVYIVEPGFIGIPKMDDTQPQNGTAKGPATKAPSKTDDELLAEFLLKNM
ncbi:MAG: pentapeptide repeat-containing protein [Deltaproteobacteria bacterium]|nr:MAG: pentapeptide repeat-containing protein [Deltaproteobacteria bacterium]